jgi:hypothetical protein
MLVQLQDPPSYMQAMPGFVHAALSAGAGAGQSAGFQHDQAELAQSQVRLP